MQTNKCDANRRLRSTTTEWRTNLLGLGLVLAAVAAPAQDQCVMLLIQSRPSTTNSVKHAHREFLQSSPPVWKWYSHRITHFDLVDSSHSTNGLPSSCSFGEGSVSLTFDWQYQYETDQGRDVITGAATNSATGFESSSWVYVDGRSAHCVGGDGYFTDWDYYYGAWWRQSTPEPGPDSVWRWAAVETSYGYSHVTGCNSPGCALGWVTNGPAVSYAYYSLDLNPVSGDVLQTQTPTQETYSPHWPFTGLITVNLSDEYTDEEFHAVLTGQLPPYPEEWADARPQASSDISRTNSDTCSGGLEQSKYRFGIPSSETNVTYQVTYDLVTTYPDGTTEVAAGLKLEIQGTGDPLEPAWSAEQELVAPPFVAGIEGTITRTVENASVSVVAWEGGGDSPAPGSGPFPLCRSCGGSRGGVEALGLNGALQAEFSLGRGMAGRPAGSLRLSAGQPAPTLATPGLLDFTAALPEVEVIRTNGVLRQVSAPQALADVVVTVPGYEYEIRFYLASQRGAKVGGLYQVTGSAFVAWKVANPDTSGQTFHQLRLTETRGTMVKTFEYGYNFLTRGWQFTAPDNLKQEEVVVIADGPNRTRQVVATVRKPGGAEVLKVRRTYQQFAWGEALVEETFDPDTNPRTTTYTYDPNNVLPTGQPPLRRAVYPDGNWEYYDYDTAGRKTAVYSPLGNEPPPDPGAPPPYNSSRRISFQYETVLAGSGDDGTRDPYTPRQTDEFLGADNLVAARYVVILPGERRDIQAVDSIGAWRDDPANLVTITRYYTNGPNLNRVRCRENPDGTMVFYDYAQAADGRQTNTVSTGQPNAQKNGIVSGTREVTILGPLGELLLKETYDVDPAHTNGILTGRESYSYTDSLNRSHVVTYLDGSSNIVQYACCGLELAVDRDGVTTQYFYDALNRLTATRRLNITTTNLLDAAGRVLETRRIGANGTQMVLRQAAYDLAGDLVYETNALNGVTSYAETLNAAGQRVRTITYPDNGTRVETYFRDGTLASLTGSAAHPVRYEYGFEGVYSSPDYGSTWTREIRLQADGSDSAEWTQTYRDALGRTYKTVYPDAACRLTCFNPAGQPWKEVDPDGVTTFYLYNARGEREYTILAVNNNTRAIPDYATLANQLASLKGGTDRVTQTLSDVAPAHGIHVRRTRTFVWTQDNNPTPTLVSLSEVSTNGLQSWHTTYPDGETALTTRTESTLGSSRVTTTIAPDQSYTITAYTQGRVTSVTRYSASGVQLERTTYAYDPHGRQSTVTDARNGATTYTFNAADQVVTVTTPAPGPGQPAQTTTTFYDSSLRAWKTTHPDGASVTNEFHPTGLLKKQAGARTYPVEYTYDYAGRLKTMTTWQSHASAAGAAVTTWHYHPQRGWLAAKRYSDSTGPDYTYTPAGRLESRLWARGNPRLTTTYAYTLAGDLETVDYSDGTPDLAYTYDRQGRQVQVVQGGSTTRRWLDAAGNLLGESYAGGPLGGLRVTNQYDLLMRRTNLAVVNSQGAVLASTACAYDEASRLSQVSSGTVTAGYSNLANSPLVEQISFKLGSTVRMTTTKQYDFLNRLTSIASLSAGSAAVGFSYSYNPANQRTVRQEADGSYWRYEYDVLGQVRSGRKYWADGTPVAGQQFEYAFDDIGNRVGTGAGGNEGGTGLRSASYSANLLNQYSSRTVPGAVDVMGVALATNAVTVNGQSVYRKGEYFRKELSVNNASTPVWHQVDVAAPNETTVTRHEFVPKTPETFTHDADGNLTQDGRWHYTWDGENRLVRMSSANTNPAVGPQQWVEFQYDWQGRRISKKVGAAGSGVATNDLRLVYDGWNLVAILNPDFSLLTSFVWGLDLSGTMEGAGGVGGLLWMTVPAGANAGTYFYAYDGNGNVMALVSAADGSVAARYEYGPFGEVLRATGPMAKANPFRFSTQYQDDETDLVCYLHRYYSPSTGRWLSKDPLGEPGFRLLAAGEQPNLVGMSDDDIERVNQTFNEPGGPNLYGICANSPISKIDRLGLDFNWGTPGPIPPAEKGAYGPFYNPEPPWFMHTADEGKPCCCKDGPAKITVKRTDTVGLLQIVMKIDLQITGCYKDLFVIWDTCWRKMDPPWKGEESGALWKDLNSTSSVFPAYGTVYRTKAHVRLLSCEDGKWKVRGAKAGRGYTRSAPMLPWDYADSTGYY